MSVAVDQVPECRRLVPLGFWLELAERSNVPYIPAEFSAPFPVNELLGALDEEPTPKLEAACEWAEEKLAADPHLMFRWECCSSGDLKYALARGADEQRLAKVRRLITIDDPRLFDCTQPDADGNTRLCVRPWHPAVRVDGYPVEFRVFCGPEGVLGVSSYYPQRPLDPDQWLPCFRGHSGGRMAPRDRAQVAAQYARLLHRVGGRFPLGFTADFLVDGDGVVLLLEGGPPHLQGPISAHPCAFAPGQIGGYAFAPRKGALTR